MMELWPFTNFHDLNLDWIIKKIRNVEDSEAAAKASEEAAETAAGLAFTYKEQAKDYKEDAADSADAAASSAESLTGLTEDLILTNDRLDNLVLNSGDGTVPSELVDVRTSWDGYTYTIAGNATRGQVEEIAEHTYNEFDMRNLNKGSVTVTNGEAIGTAAQFHTAFNSGVTLPVIPSSGRYTLRLKAYNENGGAGNGIVFRFTYTDSTTSQGGVENSATSWKDFILTSTAGKTLQSISITYATAGTNVWHVKDVVLENGTWDKYYMPRNTAVDYLARESIENSKAVTKVKPQLVRGYWDTTGPATGLTPNQYSRYVRFYRPVYLEEGSFVSVYDTSLTYVGSLKKCAKSDGSSNTTVFNNIPIPEYPDGLLVTSAGWYVMDFQKSNGNFITLDEVLSDIHFELYSGTDTTQTIVSFIGGGVNSFQAPGDATLFIGETGHTILVDSGLNQTEYNLNQTLSAKGVTQPDVFIVSHYHNDHIGALVRMLENDVWTLDEKTIYLPSDAGTTYAISAGILSDGSLDLYNRLMTEISAATDLTIVKPTEGQAVYYDGLEITFWNADQSYYISENDTNYNDFSLCCTVRYCDTTIGMSGDLGPVGMAYQAGKNRKCDLYKAQHHGWDNMDESGDTSALKDWMQTVYPNLVVSEDGIAHDQLLTGGWAPMPKWCDAHGIPFYRTNQYSPIEFCVDRYGYRMTTNCKGYTAS